MIPFHQTHPYQSIPHSLAHGAQVLTNLGWTPSSQFQSNSGVMWVTRSNSIYGRLCRAQFLKGVHFINVTCSNLEHTWSHTCSILFGWLRPDPLNWNEGNSFRAVVCYWTPFAAASCTEGGFRRTQKETQRKDYKLKVRFHSMLVDVAPKEFVVKWRPIPASGTLEIPALRFVTQPAGEVWSPVDF